MCIRDRFSPIMQSVKNFAAAGGTVLGICNGFQILCESGLLPGALVRNKGLHFVCKHQHLRVESTNSRFTSSSTKGQVLNIPIAHGEVAAFAVRNGAVEDLAFGRRTREAGVCGFHA